MAVARKTVTVLFADVADSTGLGERFDPESVRTALTRWFELASEVIDRHGGTVEKFIGDAVMAVFGVPQLHEDDAVRAIRAADELRQTATRLSDELELERGVRLAVRVGVNTGEVVTGDGVGTLVTGDAVNVAKRLEEAAGSGEVVVGKATHGLTRGSARFEPLERVSARGKSQPVDAWRLIDVERDGPSFARRFDTPLVGRMRELEQIRRAYGRAAAERTCHLFTLLGPAGIGKSRLALEFFDGVADETDVLAGRCLPYGDGITFWPLTEVLRDAGGDDAIDQLLTDTDDRDLVIERLRGVTGRANVGSQETFWAVRKVCEALARERPLVLCFEDIHWAEPTFLDLIEYLAGWIRDAPILLLCLARPEFLAERPTWLSGQENAASLTLRPLSISESDELLDALGITGASRERIAEAAEGNPLYVEQIAAMIAEGGLTEGEFAIPPTIQALLAARLDRLDAGERATIERAAVCGKEFWLDAVADLTPPEEGSRVGATLLSLVRKELIRPHQSSARAEDAFRFAHALIRDAAYAGIPKETRAALHERFAVWLGAVAGDFAAKYEELLGYHLEQAFRYRVELAPVDESAIAIGVAAADRLGAAGHRALARSDIPAAVNLLERAASLLDTAGRDAPHLLLDLGTALRKAGSLTRADGVLARAIEQAEDRDDATQAERARIERSSLRLSVDPRFDLGEAQAGARAAIEIFEQTGDDLGLAKAWRLLADVSWARLRLAEMGEVLEQARVHAERAGERQETSEILCGLCRAAVLGPTPVLEGIRRCRDTLAREQDDLGLQAAVHEILSVLLAARGEFAEARDVLERARRAYQELGIGLRAGTMYVALVDWLAGEPAAAERELRRACEELEAIGEHAELSTTAALLALALCELDRLEEAEHFAVLGEASSSPGDIASQVILRRARAKILAGGGDVERAEQLAREAVELADETDWLALRADALVDLAEAQSAVGRHDDAEECVRRAISLYETKGIVVSAERARARLGELSALDGSGQKR